MGLVGWYPLRGNADDKSGYGNHGTVSGSGSWIVGNRMGCRHFTADNSLISIPHDPRVSNAVFGVSTRLSLSVWYYATTWANYGVLVAKAFGGSWSNTTVGLWTVSNGIRFVIGSNESGNPTGSSTGPTHQPSLNEWHHFVGTIDGTTMRLYVDGVLQGTASVSNVSRERSTNTNDITIGPRTSSSLNGKVRGYVSDLRIYDHTLSEREIRDLSRGEVYRLDFNKFSEPTTNMVVNPITPTDWRLSTSTNYISHEFIDTQFGSGIRWTSDGSNFSGTLIRPLMSGHTNIDPSKPYTQSVWARTLTPGGHAYITLNTQGNNELSERRDFQENRTLSSNWKRYELNFIPETNGMVEFINRYKIYSRSNTNGVTAINEIVLPQQEMRPNVTPFVDGSRNGIVTESYGSDNVPLVLSTSPQWVNDSFIGLGAYKFSDNQVIETTFSEDDINNTDELTLSMKVKFDSLSGSQGQMFVGNQSPSNARLYVAERNGQIQMGIGNSSWSSNSSPTIVTDQWYSVLVSIDFVNNVAELYVNNVLVETNSGWTWTNSSVPITLGKHSSSNSYPFMGTLDDFRIYTSLLTETDF